MVVNKTKYLAICESDPGTQRLMDFFAAKLGFEPYIRKSCVELMSSLLEDSIIPEMILFQPTGYFNEAFRELRENPAYEPYRELPIVAVTTDPREQHFHRLLALGISAILLKPFRYQDLERVIQRLNADH